jgi:endonuclease/exonuclease/phosphatase (EEP) superfamily protein YafD
MTFKSLQWNIGGAYIRRPDADSSDARSYRNPDLDYVSGVLAEVSPDIITLQETHAAETQIQAQALAQKLGYPAAINDTYDQSHIDPSQRLGQAVISRWPVSEHSFELFLNPGYSLTRPDGTLWRSHDKGMTSVSIDLPGARLRTQTLHAIPFRPFGVDLKSESAIAVLNNMESRIDIDAAPLLVQGDFNIDSDTLASYFPRTFDRGMEECPLAAGTTPKGRKYDHVLYRGMRLIDQKIRNDVLTDHYPVITTFEIS